jgi:hypothetical protein
VIKADKILVADGILMSGYILSLIAAPSLYLFNLISGYSGLWAFTEFSQAWIHASCSIIAGSLAYLLFSDRFRILQLDFRLLSIPFVLVLYSLCVMPFHDLPLRSWFGSSRLGEGILWYFDLLVLILSSGYLMKKRISIRILSITAIISLLVLLFIHVLNNKVPFIPFKDYLAFIGITIPIILFLLFNKSDKLSLSAYLLTGLVIVYYSDNMTGIIIVSLVWPLVFFYLSITDYSWLTHRLIPSLIAIFIPLLITILFSYVNQNMVPSIWSRGLLNNIVFNTNLNIDEFIVGRGWGSFTDELIKSATTMNISLHNMFNFNEPVWDALTHLHFHSHNFISEAFISIGIFGLMAVLLFPAFFNIIRLVSTGYLFTIYWFGHWLSGCVQRKK